MAACPICGKIHAEGPCPRDQRTSEAAILAKAPLVGSVLHGTYRIDEAIGAGGKGAPRRAEPPPPGSARFDALGDHEIRLAVAVEVEHGQ